MDGKIFISVTKINVVAVFCEWRRQHVETAVFLMADIQICNKRENKRKPNFAIN
jgi:hypothetical protein